MLPSVNYHPMSWILFSHLVRIAWSAARIVGNTPISTSYSSPDGGCWPTGYNCIRIACHFPPPADDTNPRSIPMPARGPASYSPYPVIGKLSRIRVSFRI